MILPRFNTDTVCLEFAPGVELPVNHASLNPLSGEICCIFEITLRGDTRFFFSPEDLVLDILQDETEERPITMQEVMRGESVTRFLVDSKCMSLTYKGFEFKIIDVKQHSDVQRLTVSGSSVNIPSSSTETTLTLECRTR